MIQPGKHFASIAVLAGLLVQPIELPAQSGAGSIQGTIQDATEARCLPATSVS